MGNVASASFEDWFAELAASGDDPADMAGKTLATVQPGVRAFLEEQYAAYGPLAADDLAVVVAAEGERLVELKLQTCHRLLPAVLKDGAAYGQMGLQVTFVPIEDSPSDGLLMEVTHPHWSLVQDYGDNEPDGPGPALGWDADTLAWLATGIQEACLLGPLPEAPHYWPLCPRHGAGVHPRVEVGAAVWWCSAGVGHVVALVGEVVRH